MAPLSADPVTLRTCGDLVLVFLVVPLNGSSKTSMASTSTSKKGVSSPCSSDGELLRVLGAVYGGAPRLLRLAALARASRSLSTEMSDRRVVRELRWMAVLRHPRDEADLRLGRRWGEFRLLLILAACGEIDETPLTEFAVFAATEAATSSEAVGDGRRAGVKGDDDDDDDVDVGSTYFAARSKSESLARVFSSIDRMRTCGASFPKEEGDDKSTTTPTEAGSSRDDGSSCMVCFRLAVADSCCVHVCFAFNLPTRRGNFVSVSIDCKWRLQMCCIS